MDPHKGTLILRNCHIGFICRGPHDHEAPATLGRRNAKGTLLGTQIGNPKNIAGI